MNPPQPILSNQALADLDDIWLFIAQDSPTAADGVIDEIYAAIRKLAEFPGMGHLRDDLIDEPAFSALRHGVTVRIGRIRPTKARYILANIGEVDLFLKRLEGQFAH